MKGRSEILGRLRTAVSVHHPRLPIQEAGSGKRKLVPFVRRDSDRVTAFQVTARLPLTILRVLSELPHVAPQVTATET